MAYQSAKPEAADRKNISQGDIAGNFTAINTLVNVDHETFDIAAQGKHKQTTFPQQGAAPSTTATEFALYTKTDGANPALFVRKPSDGAEINMTTLPTVSTTLPNGLIFKWGTGTFAAGSATSTAITFATAFPTGVYNCQLTHYGTRAGAAQDYVLSVSTFNVTTLTGIRTAAYVGTSAPFYYFAIGY